MRRIEPTRSAVLHEVRDGVGRICKGNFMTQRSPFFPKATVLPRVLRAALVCAMLLAASAGSAAEVEGKAIIVTQGGKPLADAEVRLLAVSHDATEGSATAATDANGEFRFRRVRSAPNTVYRLETTYAGLRQTSEPFPVGEDRTRKNLAVYDTTSTPEDITVEKVHVIVNPDANGVGVTSIYIVQNRGAIFLGDPATEGDNRRTGVRFLLPTNATDFQVLQGVLAAHHKVTPWGFASTIPFYPSSDTLVYSYLIPWQGKRASFDLESPYTIASLSVIAMPGAADLKVDGGESRTSPTEMGAGQGLVNIGRANIPANTPVSVEVLPPRRVGATGALSAGQWLMIVAGAAMVVVILFAVQVRRKQSEQALRRPVAEPIGKAEASSAARGEPGLKGSALVDSLVEQIADLDDAYEREQIEEADYVSRRRALKAELIKAVKAK